MVILGTLSAFCPNGVLKWCWWFISAPLFGHAHRRRSAHVRAHTRRPLCCWGLCWTNMWQQFTAGQESGMPSTGSMNLLKSKTHCSSHFLPSSSLLYNCGWAPLPPDHPRGAIIRLTVLQAARMNLPQGFEQGNISKCKAKAAGEHGSSTLNRANVALENGSPSWNATGKGGVICPLPSP